VRPLPSVPRRTDALANRTALLDAAERAFLRHGPRVALDVVAREAGVGIGTLYRNFRDRDALLAAVVHRSYELVAGLAQAAADSPAPPLDALMDFFTGLIERRERLVLPLLGGPRPASGNVDPLSEAISAALDTIVQRGVERGDIRPDVSAIDLYIAGVMLARAQLPGPAGTTAATRIAGILVDGLRPQAHTQVRPPELTRRELDSVITGRTAEPA
jgi:AcrR family transcriptional regulator